MDKNHLYIASHGILTEETSATEENTETEQTAGEAVETEKSPSSTEDVLPPPSENTE